MKKICLKISDILSWIIGYALLICLFAGGMGAFVYIVALIIGGENATNICIWLYKTYYVYLIKISTITTLLCFLMIYLKGDANWINPFKYWKEKIKEKNNK